MAPKKAQSNLTSDLCVKREFDCSLSFVRSFVRLSEDRLQQALRSSRITAMHYRRPHEKCGFYHMLLFACPFFW
jgi:hypothetical protein